MLRWSGILSIALLSATLLVSTASAGPGGNSTGDPDIPNGCGKASTHVEFLPVLRKVETVDSQAVTIERSTRWAPMIRLIMNWARVAAR